MRSKSQVFWILTLLSRYLFSSFPLILALYLQRHIHFHSQSQILMEVGKAVTTF